MGHYTPATVLQVRLAIEIRNLLEQVPSEVLAQLTEWESSQLTTVVETPEWLKRQRGEVSPLGLSLFEAFLLGSLEALSRIAPSPEVQARVAFMRMCFRPNGQRSARPGLTPVRIQVCGTHGRTVH